MARQSIVSESRSGALLSGLLVALVLSANLHAEEPISFCNQWSSLMTYQRLVAVEQWVSETPASIGVDKQCLNSNERIDSFVSELSRFCEVNPQADRADAIDEYLDQAFAACGT